MTLNARARLLACLLSAALQLPATELHAAVEQKVGRFAGIDVTYRVILPDGFDPARPYPVILHFAGGSQTLQIVERSTETDWRRLAEQRGYIVISPAATDGRLYFAEGARIFPAFIDHILKSYNVAGGKLHVTGHSNGGLSAFHVASRFPQYFLSVTGYPGLLQVPAPDRLAALQPLCIYMHVGDQDGPWREGMQQQFTQLRDRGSRVSFRVEPGQGHRLDVTKGDLAARLFAEIEQARRGCGA